MTVQRVPHRECDKCSRVSISPPIYGKQSLPTFWSAVDFPDIQHNNLPCRLRRETLVPQAIETKTSSYQKIEISPSISFQKKEKAEVLASTIREAGLLGKNSHSSGHLIYNLLYIKRNPMSTLGTWTLDRKLCIFTLYSLCLQLSYWKGMRQLS